MAKKKEKAFKKNSSVVFEVYAYLANLFTKVKYDFERAKYLVKASNYAPNKSKRKSILWEASLLFGVYQDFEQMEETLEQLKKVDPKWLKQEKNKVQIARLYFFGSDKVKAWNRVYPFIKDSDALPTSWLLLSDLFYYSYDSKDKLYDVIMGFLKKREKQLKGNSYVRPLWAYIYKEPFEDQKAKWQELREKLQPSDLSVENAIALYNKTTKQKVEKISKSNLAVMQMKMKISDVSRYVKYLGDIKGQINGFIDEWRPQIAGEALCLAAEETEFVGQESQGA